MASPASTWWWWAALVAHVVLPIVDGCTLVDRGGLVAATGEVTWLGCHNCPPSDFTSEIHILRLVSDEGAPKHTTVKVRPYANVIPASLTIVLVSIDPVDWLLILQDKKIRISRLFLIAVSPEDSQTFVLGQEIAATRITMMDPSRLSLDRVMSVLKLNPSFLTSYAVSKASGEWRLRVGVTGPGSVCAGVNGTGPGLNQESGSRGRSVLSFQRGLGIGGFSLLVLTVIGLSWWWRHRRAKGIRDRQDREVSARRTGAPRRESTRVRQVEAPAPPVYTPYDPPPPYEELPAGGVPVEAVITNGPPPYVPTPVEPPDGATSPSDQPAEPPPTSPQPAPAFAPTDANHL